MKNILYSLLLVLFLTACKDDFFDQVVDVKIPEHTPALAITSTLSNQDTIIYAYVTTSIGVLEPYNPGYITDAKVELFKDGDLVRELPYVDQSFYAWQLDEPLGNEQSTYELRVEKEDFETVMATQIMPAQIEITNATFERDGTIDEGGDRVDELVIEFTDQKDVSNYYKVEVALEYDFDGTTYLQEGYYFDSNDPSTSYTNDGIYLSDAVFDGSTYEFRLYNYDLYVDASWENPELIVRLVNMSSDRYYRETSINAYQNAEDNPFAEPAVIHNNIENGYGIFSLEAVGPAFRIPL